MNAGVATVLVVVVLVVVVDVVDGASVVVVVDVVDGASVVVVVDVVDGAPAVVATAERGVMVGVDGPADDAAPEQPATSRPSAASAECR